MDWILLLALGTLVLVVAFLVWNRISTKRHQESRGTATGVGGSNDPMSGTGADVRHPDTMRAALDQPTGIDASEAPEVRNRPRG